MKTQLLNVGTERNARLKGVPEELRDIRLEKIEFLSMCLSLSSRTRTTGSLERKIDAS